MPVPFPSGMGVRRAGPAPTMQPTSNIYSDLGQVATDIGGQVDEATKRKAMIDNMVEKRRLASEAQASKARFDQLNLEIKQEERDDLEKARERKSGFYEDISQLDPMSPEYQQSVESALFKHQQIDPQKYYLDKFGRSKTQAPKAEIMYDEDGHPWQISKSFGETQMIPITPPGGGPTPTKFVPPKGAQVIYGEGGKAYTLAPGETVAQPLAKGAEGGEQLTKQQINPKLKMEIKGKINKIQIAKQQLEKIRKSFQPGSISFGPVQGHLPSEKGQLFDQAVNALRTTFRSLTRTPGEGSMSDMETRLSQAALPDRTKYEAVTQEQIDQLGEMLDFLESGYNTDEFVAKDSVGAQPSPQEAPEVDPNDRLGIKSGNTDSYSNDPMGILKR